MISQKQIEKMAKYVSASVCAEKISEVLTISLGDLVDIFADIPSADVAEVSRAHWKKSCNERTCSKCGFKYWANGVLFAYCPECGSVMEGEQAESPQYMQESEEVIV